MQRRTVLKGITLAATGPAAVLISSKRRVDLLQHHENIRMEDADRIFAPEGAM